MQQTKNYTSRLAEAKCRICGGNGWVVHTSTYSHDKPQKIECSDCNGTGWAHWQDRIVCNKTPHPEHDANCVECTNGYLLPTEAEQIEYAVEWLAKNKLPVTIGYTTSLKKFYVVGQEGSCIWREGATLAEALNAALCEIEGV